ncbi:MAG TPA: alpha/beta hydrolase [Mycobacteriales bacterium]|nr:alpha/beta hydrolase [Mycobacteriales bacterium]
MTETATSAELADLLAAADQAAGTDVEAMTAVWRATVAAGAVSAELAGAYADRLWFTVWRGDPGDRVREREAAWFAPMVRTDRDVAGHHVATYAAGEGPSVVLVHGWADYAARMGAFVAPLLAAGFRVVTADLPAHGASPGTQTNLYEMSDIVSSLVAESSAVAVVGHSLGGMTAVFAAAQCDPAPALALLAPAVRLENAFETFGRLFQLPPAALEGLRATIDARFGADVWENTRGEVIARGLDVPALVLHDHDDDQVPLDDGHLMAMSLPRSEFVETAGLGHAKLIRDDDVVRRVVDFLATVVVDATSGR